MELGTEAVVIAMAPAEGQTTHTQACKGRDFLEQSFTWTI